MSAALHLVCVSLILAVSCSALPSPFGNEDYYDDGASMMEFRGAQNSHDPLHMLLTGNSLLLALPRERKTSLLSFFNELKLSQGTK